MKIFKYFRLAAFTAAMFLLFIELLYILNLVL